MEAAMTLKELEDAVAAIPAAQREEVTRAARDAADKVLSILDRVGKDGDYRARVGGDPRGALCDAGLTALMDGPHADAVAEAVRAAAAAPELSPCLQCQAVATSAIATVLLGAVFITSAMVPLIFVALVVIALFAGLTMPSVISTIGMTLQPAGAWICQSTGHC